MATTPDTKHALDNRSAQLDPTQPAYHRSRGLSEAEAAAAAARAQEVAGGTRVPSGGGASPHKRG